MPPIDLQTQRAVRGEPTAIARLIDRWSRPIRLWALAAMGDAPRADDAAQDALLKVLKALPTFDPSRPLEPWLRTVVRNTCTDHHRSRSRQRTAPLQEVPMEPTVRARIDLDTGARKALAAVEHLTERQREVLLLVDHGDSTPSEVANLLGLAPGTVRALLFKARRSVRTRMLADNPELLALLEDS